MKRDVILLEEILLDPEKFSRSDFVFAAIKDDISVFTEVVVISASDPEIHDDYISVSGYSDLKFEEFLAVDDFLQIKENILMQNKIFDVDTMMTAVKYYFENDAFLEFHT